MRKTYLFGLPTAAALFLGGSLMPSRVGSASASYSSPVMVMNTAGAPVQSLDVERASRIPYSSAVNQTCPNPACIFAFTTPPAGFRLVVESVSAVLSVVPNSAAPSGQLYPSNLNGVTGFPVTLGGQVGPGIVATANQPVVRYFDPSDGVPLVQMAGSFSSVVQEVILTGYLQNCSVASCPPVQH